MENENKKYIITIDGPDCSGKTTLWKKVVLDGKIKDVQIRGIVSNIAYALKYNRDIDALINLYNENPVNYVVYLLNPINDKKLEMLYNRCRNNVYNNDFIINELKDASNTWIDIKYFDRAIEILKEKYKGDIQIVRSVDNQLEQFYNAVNKFELETLDNIKIFGPIKLLRTPIDDFESEAKKVSEFKYIVFMAKISKDEVISNLYEGLDDEYKKMLDKLFEYSNETAEDVYDSLESPTIDNLINYLDNYELYVEVNVRVDINTYSDVHVPLRNINYDIESAIYNDDDIMNDLYNAAKDDVYNCDLDVSVEIVR